MSQSLAKLYLHAIFSTKDREPTLADTWRDELFQVLGGTANNLGCRSLIVGGVSDHVHLLFQLGRTITVADAVGKIKSTSSAWVNQTRGGAVAVSLARRIRRVFGKPVKRGGRARVHSPSARASRSTVVSGRVARMAATIRGLMGRAVRVGLSSQGFALG